MILFRIATETRQYLADDLSGRGAAVSPGRWNEAGQAALYVASSRALAVLETAAHLQTSGLPLNRYLLEIEIDPRIWRKRTRWDPQALPVGWDAIPAGRSSVQVGADWLAAGKTALLEVPSVVVPEESAVVINPAHPEAQAMKARNVRRFSYHGLFR